MPPLLYTLLAAALSVALLAFGWMPCPVCCGNTDCCPGVVIPDTLLATFTVVSGGACPAGLDGHTVTLTRSPGSQTWSGTNTTSGGILVQVFLICASGAWAPSGTVGTTGSFNGGTAGSIVCDPFLYELLGTRIGFTDCFVDVTYTEVP